MLLASEIECKGTMLDQAFQLTADRRTPNILLPAEGPLRDNAEYVEARAGAKGA